jgi:cytochrome P450
MKPEGLLSEITKPATRPNPFPLYAEARAAGIVQQDGGAYLVSRHREVTALLHDPRVSSNPNNIDNFEGPIPAILPFISRDGADHDRLRRLAMSQFGPPDHASLVSEREPEIVERVDALLSQVAGRTEIDVVQDLAYPLPVAVICRLLGVPDEDEPKFHTWADDIVRSAGAVDQENAKELIEEREKIQVELATYLNGLIARHRERPTDCVLSRLANDPSDDRMSDADLMVTGVLLLVAGHETTVNLIANGALTMMRQPKLRERLRDDPEIALRFVEELLRMESPVQYLPNRVAVADIDIGGLTIPKGARIVLLTAAASRDPDRFPNPDEFDPDRPDNQHFGFGGGIHYCFGAPLARLEGQIALTELARRLDNPRLVDDPPPYRPSPVLRGPLHLKVTVDRISS